MSKISWFIKDNEAFYEKKEYHAGTYRSDETIELNMQVWNNRWGTEDVSDVIAPVLSIKFGTLEDSSLLELIKVIVNGSSEPPATIKDKNAVFIIGETLSGKGNDGDEGDYLNRKNFFDVKIIIDIKNKTLKENDLKTMYLELNPLS